jgi:hypothetical protein
MENLPPSIPSIHELTPNTLFNESACISFLIEKGIFYGERQCPECETDMKLCLGRESFRCSRKNCRKEISIRKDSFFAGHKLPVLQPCFLVICG